ncbi:hypothetical protein ALC56_12680, partial [Trachymyrmex septentrionalis]
EQMGDAVKGERTTSRVPKASTFCYAIARSWRRDSIKRRTRHHGRPINPQTQKWIMTFPAAIVHAFYYARDSGTFYQVILELRKVYRIAEVRVLILGCFIRNLEPSVSLRRYDRTKLQFMALNMWRFLVPVYLLQFIMLRNNININFICTVMIDDLLNLLRYELLQRAI